MRHRISIGITGELGSLLDRVRQLYPLAPGAPVVREALLRGLHTMLKEAPVQPTTPTAPEVDDLDDGTFPADVDV